MYIYTHIYICVCIIICIYEPHSTYRAGLLPMDKTLAPGRERQGETEIGRKREKERDIERQTDRERERGTGRE